MQLERMSRAQGRSRRGPDHRMGEQVSFLEVKQHFGLGHVRVGRWVTAEESLIAANLVFDALADLAMVLGLPPGAMGLRQRLNLAFGHGGQQGVMAHYSPSERTLALAKHAGAGALAHEFWHAFDHHLCDTAMDTGRAPAGRFASELWLKDVPLICHPLNDRLDALFHRVLLNEAGTEPHEYVREAIRLDKALGRQYFAHPSELMARAFEACIEAEGCFELIDTDSGEISSQPLVNPYLVTGTLGDAYRHNEEGVNRVANSSAAAAPSRFGSRSWGSWGSMPAGAFPTASHRSAIMVSLHAYFGPLGQALAREVC